MKKKVRGTFQWVCVSGWVCGCVCLCARAKFAFGRVSVYDFKDTIHVYVTKNDMQPVG